MKYFVSILVLIVTFHGSFSRPDGDIASQVTAIIFDSLDKIDRNLATIADRVYDRGSESAVKSEVRFVRGNDGQIRQIPVRDPARFFTTVEEKESRPVIKRHIDELQIVLNSALKDVIKPSRRNEIVCQAKEVTSDKRAESLMNFLRCVLHEVKESIEQLPNMVPTKNDIEKMKRAVEVIVQKVIETVVKLEKTQAYSHVMELLKDTETEIQKVNQKIQVTLDRVKTERM